MQLIDRNFCTGCGNCINICPQKAIEYEKDKLGNVYPKIDHQKCIECELCKKSCPSEVNMDVSRPFKCYAAYSKDDNVRLKSASGGVAASMYMGGVSNGYAAWGVALDANNEAHFIEIKTTEDVEKVQNSKYTFSFMDDTVKKICEKLKSGEKLIFVGLPCQVAAVKNYVALKHINSTRLFLVEIICHGVPSSEYLKQHVESKTNIKDVNISFRDYLLGTSNFIFSIRHNGDCLYHKKVESGDNYQIAYHSAVFYRPNCYNCKYASPQRIADLTIGDFAGLGKLEKLQFNLKEEREKGVSCLLVNTNKGIELLENIDVLQLFERPLDEPLRFEPQLSHPSIPSKYREQFIANYPAMLFTKTCNKIFFIEKIKRPIIRKLKDIVKKILRM